MNNRIVHQYYDCLLFGIRISPQAPQCIVDIVLIQGGVDTTFDDLTGDDSVLRNGSNQRDGVLLLLYFRLSH
jgi:hypothetical protein